MNEQVEKKIKVLFITNYVYLYGANRSLLILLENISKDIHVVVVVPYKFGDFNDELIKRNIPYIISGNIFSNVFIWDKSVIWVKRVFRYYLVSLARYIISSLYVKFVFSNIVKKTANFDYVYSNSSIITLGYSLAKNIKARHIHHLRELPKLDYNCYYVIGDKRVKRKMESSYHIIAISRCVYNYFNLSDKNAHIIYNGINEKSVMPKQIGFHINILILGVINDNKGQKNTILALKKFLKENTSYHVDIVGGGDIRGLEKIILENNLCSKITVHGYQEDVDTYYEKAHVFIMASKYEAFGRVTVEALSNGVPVIGLRGYNATSEIIIDNFNGYLVNDLNEIPTIIEKLCVADNYKEKSANAIQSSKKFSIENYVNSIKKILTDTDIIITNK